MKSHPRLILLFVVGLLSLAAAASGADRKIDMLAVAEQFPLQKDRQTDAPATPSSYVLIDGGFIEAGDPVAGEHPPAPPTVTAALQDALTSAGYTRASAGAGPTLALIYHWGVIRAERMPLRVPFRLQPNLRTRLSLVTPAAQFPTIEDRIIARRDYTPAALQMIEYPDVRDALDLARNGLYFAVVSAYDYAALARGETTLLWRTKLTAPLNSGMLADVVHSLLQNAAPYLGRHLARRDRLEAPLFESPDATDASPPPAPPDGLDASHVATVLANERAEFSGQPVPQPKPRKASSTSTDLPPQLARRIAAYHQEKSALQAELAHKIKAGPDGGDQRRTIDAFSTEQASRIAAVDRERESIRRELAQLAAANSSARRDKSLDGLLREFSADARLWESAALNRRE